MVKSNVIVLAVLATSLVVGSVNAALYEEDFTTDAGKHLTHPDLGYGSFAGASNIQVTDVTSFGDAAIDGNTSSTGWSRLFRPFDGGSILSGPVVMDIDMDPGNDEDAEFGYFGFDGSNVTSDRLVSMRWLAPNPGSGNPDEPGGMCISRAVEGNVCSGINGRVHVRFAIDLDTNAMTALVTGLDGQGANSVSGTLNNQGLGLTAVYVTAAQNDGFAVDNILIDIPEPASVGLLSLGALMMLKRRRGA
ncbi:MAG: hypothetical protein CMJ18_02635 [Phycisphaeraceae bacterium]|nr:hypothetical protein [Phycisphaeraceae bacterium]